MSTLGGVSLWRRRGLERALLLFPLTILALGLAAIELAREGSVGSLLLTRCAAFALLLYGLHVWLCWRLPYSDELLLPTGAGLLALGQIMMERLVPDLATRQLVWLAISIGVTLVVLHLMPSVQWLRQWKYTWALLGMALVLATFLFGIDPNGSGARLWLGAGGVYFQPSEVLKVLLVVFLAAYLDDHRELLAWAGPRLGRLRLPPLPYLAPLLLMLGLSLAVVALQHDLGAGVLYFGTFMVLLYVASGRASYVALGGAAMLLGGALVVQHIPYANQRVELWLNPWIDPDGNGYQIIQALIALASGGVLGSGLTYGYPGYVPAVFTDYVIAAIGEEMGLVGSLGVVALYMIWMQRGLAIALASKRSFSTLLAVGLTTVLALQALVILGGTLRLLPLTGITLPFISYGGSSLLINVVLVGLLLAISDERRESSYV